MEAEKSKPNQEHQNENGNSPSSQHKSQSPPLPVASDEPMKITDLDDDCLEKIFGYLNLRCLFNVAAANVWLRPAVGVVYKRKFVSKIIITAIIRKHIFVFLVSKRFCDICVVWDHRFEI